MHPLPHQKNEIKYDNKVKHNQHTAGYDSHTYTPTPVWVLTTWPMTFKFFALIFQWDMADIFKYCRAARMIWYGVCQYWHVKSNSSNHGNFLLAK